MDYEYSKGYQTLRFFERIALTLHYRKIVYSGTENIDENNPIIFASNHRNAVIDPLLLLNKCKKQPVFLARADIFKKPAIARILKWLHIMPVYRMRDGAENLANNSDSFQLSGNLLKKRIPMALYPEGKHNPKMSLLPVQKAISRIVLPIEEDENFELGTEIVPVGLYYTDIFGFLSDAYVTFGKPIKVSDYQKQYEENPNITANLLRKDLEIEMRKLIVNISNDEFYNEYTHAIDWNAKRLTKEKYVGKKDGFLLASQEVVRNLDNLFENDRNSFNEKIRDFRKAKEIIDKHGLTTKDKVATPSSLVSLIAQLLLLIVSFPITVFGFINGALPILGYKKLLTLFKDNQFIPSIRAISGLFLVPIFTFIQSLIVGFIFNWWYALAYFFVMPATFYFACWWRKWMKQWVRKWKVNRFEKKFPEAWRKLTKLIRL